MPRTPWNPEMLRRVLWMLAFVGAGWLVGSSPSDAQSTFEPPPSPTMPTSAVRGVYDPNALPSSPAILAPPPATHVDPPPTAPSSGPTPSSKAEPLEGGEIIARVDGQIVLASDVLWQVNQMLDANRQRIRPGEEENIRRMLLRQQVMGLIDTKLLYADFRRAVPAENIPTIEKNLKQPFQESEIPRLLKMLGLEGREGLVSMLEQSGTSLADVERQFKERTIASEWLRQRVPPAKPVTHEQMLEHYQANLADYEYPAQARWEEIMIRKDRVAGDRAAAYRAVAEMGNEVWQLVSKNSNVRGPVFTEIAKQKSHGFTAGKGGRHDWTTRGALRSKAIDEALFQLQVGQLSNVIESDDGFHIVRVLERKEAGRTPFTVAQADIRKAIENQQRQTLVEQEMVKLRKKSRVWTIFDGDLSGPEVAELLDRKKRR